jgi:O-antigen/teichoic acid export membrane protein
MSIWNRFLLKSTLWTIGIYGLGQVLRVITNIMLARLLAPELFGIMLLVTSLTVGIELISDVGIGQNIIYHKDANDPDFYNTAWTLQAMRGVLLWLVALIVAWPVARTYQYPSLIFIVPCATFGMVLTGFTPINRFLLQKRLQIAKINVFDAFVSFASSVAYILLAYLNPTIWALVIGGLFKSMATMVGSYFLLPEVKQRFHLSKPFTREILHFGKWIFFSSVVYFLATNFDALYLAKVVPLKLLGVYGIARSISELLSGLVMHVGNNVVFPFIASQWQMERADLREQLAPLRARLLLLTALGISFLIATADLIVKILYDERYQAVSQILPILIMGSWFSILCNLNESTLLGVGKPFYSAISNSLKFALLLIGLPLSVKVYGVLGGIIVIALVNPGRYIAILVGQRRERFSFGMQDLSITLTMFSLISLWEWLRWILGFGTSFGSFSTAVSETFLSLLK